MSKKPTAAGKSSIDLIDQDAAFAQIITDSAAAYLDLACGAGNYTLALARRLGKDSSIHALDLWEDGVAALQESARREGLDNVTARVADITRPLPLPDGSIDVCLIATALHDIPEARRGRVLAEAGRVLRPGGRLALIEFKKSDQGPGPSKERKIGEADAEELAAPHGFRKDISVSLGEYTYLVRFVRN